MSFNIMRNMIKPVLLNLTLILSMLLPIPISGCVQTNPEQRSKQTSALEDRLKPYFRLSKPEGDRPFPAIALVSGCSGFYHPKFAKQYERYAQRLWRSLDHVITVLEVCIEV